MKRIINVFLVLTILFVIPLSTVFAQTIPQGYRNLLQTYRDTLQNGTYDSDNLGDFGGGEVPSGEFAMTNCGYGFLDLNGDGVQELVIGVCESSHVAAFYTLENGQPKLLRKTESVEDGISLMPDIPQNPAISNTLNRTYLSSNGGEISGVRSFYRLEGTNLVFSVSYTENYSTHKNYTSTDENNPFQREISAIPEETNNRRENYSLTPFGNFPTLPVEGPEGSIYRVNNPDTGEHLYTLWFNEATELCQNGWMNEGISWTAPTTSDTPIYRLYNAAINDHLYTSDPHEVQILTTEQNWVSDNDGNPVMYSGGDVPIYRLYNPTNYRHLLTKDANEYNTLPQFGWKQEDVAMYSMS